MTPDGMMPVETCTVLAFVPNALMDSQVGTWESDVTNDRTVADATAALLFGVDPVDATHGVPLSSYIQNIHTDDRPEFRQKLSGIRDHGGLFVVEFRTCPSPRDVRWVLARGRYERDPHTGRVVGRGIVIDITDSKSDGRLEDRAFFTTRAVPGPSLAHVAELAMEARSEIDELGERQDSPLRRAVDALLWIIGRTLAQRGTVARTHKDRLN